MKLSLRTASALVFLVACGSGDAAPAPTTVAASPPPAASSTTSPTPTPPATVDPPPPVQPTPSTLKVSWLGVQGFLLESGDDAVLTAPLYTRPSVFEAST